MKTILLLTGLVWVLASCHTTKPGVPQAGESGGSEKLYARKWSLREVEGLTLMPSTVGGVAFLQFFPGQVNTVSGSTGCNSLRGTFELMTGQKIRFSPFATTKMMCAPDGNNTEQRFLSALGKTDGYSVTDESLILLHGTEVVSRLAAVPADSSAPR